MAEKEKDTKERYEITQVAVETAPAYLDNKDGETISQIELLKRIANDVEALKKQLTS